MARHRQFPVNTGRTAAAARTRNAARTTGRIPAVGIIPSVGSQARSRNPAARAVIHTGPCIPHLAATATGTIPAEVAAVPAKARPTGHTAAAAAIRSVASAER